MSKFEKVMANLRESLAHATPEEDGQPSYVMIRKDELEALIQCAEDIEMVIMRNSGHYQTKFVLKRCFEEIEALGD